MILFRYIRRELWLSFVGILMVLLTVFATNYFARLLSRAARGDLPADLVLQLLLLNLPYFLGILLPLSFFLALLMVQGRLYADSELTAMKACGFSANQLLACCFRSALVVALACSAIYVWLSPLGLLQMDLLEQRASNKSDLSLINPGSFQVLGSKVLFVERNDSQDKDRLQQVLVFGENPRKEVQLMQADAGAYRYFPEFNADYLELSQGQIWQGEPGQAQYLHLSFSTYQFRIKERMAAGRAPRTKSLSVASLWQAQGLAEQAEWQWRWSMPLSILILTLIAVPLGRIAPRAGKFSRFLPGIGLYFLYFMLLTLSRNLLEKGKLPVELGLWWVHALFALLALILLWPQWRKPGSLAMKQEAA